MWRCVLPRGFWIGVVALCACSGPSDDTDTGEASESEALDLLALSYADRGVVFEHTLLYGGEVLTIDASDPSVGPATAGG
jgi:hypothetical protein